MRIEGVCARTCVHVCMCVSVCVFFQRLWIITQHMELIDEASAREDGALDHQSAIVQAKLAVFYSGIQRSIENQIC